MKNIFFALLMVFIGIDSIGQEAKVLKENFYSTGELKSKFIEINRSLVQVTYYFQSGVISETGFYVNEKLTGKWKTYNIDSELISIGYFEDNQKSGIWSFFKDGDLVNEISYESHQFAEK
ncbi:MAG: toxin-antitoxin system YwqK family antitoxin [Salibacteraceae bacterium]